MAVHDWRRVTAGTFHDFHSSWIVHLKEALNSGMLPADYYALAEQHGGRMIPDVLTLSTSRRGETAMPEGPIAVAEAPPKVSITMMPDEQATYLLARRTLAIRHSSGHRIIALIEIVSPGNKDRLSSVEDFVDKAISALKRGIHLLVVDLFPPGRFDPGGIHGAIWASIDSQVYSPPEGKPLTLAAYAAATLPRAYVEPIAVGSVLPEMPLFLHPEWYVNAPLEKTYQAAYRGVPAFWRDVIEGRAPPPPEEGP